MKNFLIILFALLFSSYSSLYAEESLERTSEKKAESSKALGLGYQMLRERNSASFHLVASAILDFVNLALQGKADADYEKIIFNLFRDHFNNGAENYWAVYYNLILLGYGADSDKLKLLEMQEAKVENNPQDIRELEMLAFFYDKGIVVEIDAQKAKELRAKIDSIVAEKSPMDRYRAYMGLAVSLYTLKSKALHKIYAPEMQSYYSKKAKAYQYEMNIAAMSEQDQAFMQEFRDIFRLFCDENGNGLKGNKITAELKAQLASFYEKVIDAESQAIKEMAEYAVIYRDKSIGLDSLQFRVLSLPYFLQASDYCPKLYPLLTYCYHYGRACRGDKKIAAPLYLKQALYVKNPDEKRSAFRSAHNLYRQLGDYDALKTIIEESEKSLGSSITLDIAKARFYLMESPYKDVEYARVLIEKIKQGATQVKDFSNILSNLKADYLDLGQLQFWAATKFYESSKDKNWNYAYRVLAKAYMDGIYCEKDMQKASNLLVEYAKNLYEHNGEFIIDSLAQLMIDVENKDEVLFEKTLEEMLSFRQNSIPLNLMKALAIDKGFGYEKDIAQRDIYLQKAATNNGLYFLTKNYAHLSPSDSLLEKLAELSPKVPHTQFDAYVRLGNLEEAVKYGKLYDSSNIEKEYYYENAAYLILKGKSPEELAKRYEKPKNRGQRLIYASMLYTGFGLEQDKEKALEDFKNSSELWDKAVGNDARIWLWKYYAENGQATEADALVDPKTKGLSLYHSKFLVSTAKAFTDNLDIDTVSRTFNLPESKEYAQYFLSLAEDKYLSSYAEDLIALYGRNPKLKNLEKKLEIRKKARALLDYPKPSKVEEVNYTEEAPIIWDRVKSF